MEPRRSRVYASLLVVMSVVSPLSRAEARPWNGVEPGATSREQVIAKFGEPSRAVTQGDKELLAYYQKQAIRGTVQTQFRIALRTKLVERIDIFPGPAVDRAAVEGSYGPECQASDKVQQRCYVKKITDDFRMYFHYTRIGLAVFFKEDGRTVHSLSFQEVKR